MKHTLLWLIQHLFYVLAQDIGARTQSGVNLIIAPHPDDETLGCGGTIARACKAGQKNRIIIVTDGSAAGHSSKISYAELARMRREEVTKAVEALGAAASDMVLLDFADTKASQNIPAIQEALRMHIVDSKPTQIYSPYGVDMNPDHIAVATAIDNLCKAGAITCPVYEYPIWFPAKPMILHAVNPLFWTRLRYQNVKAFLGAKKKALDAHHSQIVNITGESGWFTLTPRFVARFFYGFELFFEKPKS